MCIRDREYAVQVRRKDEAGAPEQDFLDENKLAEGTTYYDLCLLYTSDAADERSSVDLGGRRIIKKKNKIKNR